MRKAKEILRLKFEAGLGNHKIARASRVSASTVWDTVARFQMTGLPWPLPAEHERGGARSAGSTAAGAPWRRTRSGCRTGPRCSANSGTST